MAETTFNDNGQDIKAEEGNKSAKHNRKCVLKGQRSESEKLPPTSHYFLKIRAYVCRDMKALQVYFKNLQE